MTDDRGRDIVVDEIAREEVEAFLKEEGVFFEEVTTSMGMICYSIAQTQEDLNIRERQR